MAQDSYLINGLTNTAYAAAFVTEGVLERIVLSPFMFTLMLDKERLRDAQFPEFGIEHLACSAFDFTSIITTASLVASGLYYAHPIAGGLFMASNLINMLYTMAEDEISG